MRTSRFETRICAWCGEDFEFNIAPWIVASRSGKYCSRACSGAAQRYRHGHTTHTSLSPTYRSWAAMIQRCHNPKSTAFHKYGARGIIVCDRWRESFDNFLADMGERPAGCTMDRIDGRRGYGPDNCRWATATEQSRNLASNRLIEHEGVVRSAAEWAEMCGIRHGTLLTRLRRGWSVEDALGRPPCQGERRPGLRGSRPPVVAQASGQP